MTFSEDIAVKVREVLLAAHIDGVAVVWSRHGYDTDDEIVIVPHHSDGEGSMRDAVVMVNIHCPDKFDGNAYEANFNRLTSLKRSVVDALKNHVWKGTGINWEVTNLTPPLQEPDHHEHFVNVRVVAHIREKQN